jgi:hypothetical protein
MRCFCRFAIWWGLATLLVGLARGAETFVLSDGQTISGNIVSGSDDGLRVRQEDGNLVQVTLPNGKNSTYVPWSRFTQDDLKKLAENDKLRPFVDPWIDLPPPRRAREQAFAVKDIKRLSRPGPGSFFVGFASSGIGLAILCVIYLANLYAAYEISIMRAYPWPLVCGLAAVVPIVVPVIFVCLPVHTKHQASDDLASLAAAEQAAALQGQSPAASAPASGLGLAARGEAASTELPPTQTFARGQFTFNRRFFETKFANFFGMIRRESEKDLLLIFKTGRGQFVAERITRIAANDLHLEVKQGRGSAEVVLPFTDVTEVVLKHKDAPD